jgi:hypothetical protein
MNPNVRDQTKLYQLIVCPIHKKDSLKKERKEERKKGENMM